jgi:hypothetical protein
MYDVWVLNWVVGVEYYEIRRWLSAEKLVLECKISMSTYQYSLFYTG